MSNSCSFEFQQCFKCCYHLALPLLTAIYCLPALVICICTGRQRERIRCRVETVLLQATWIQSILWQALLGKKPNTFQSISWKVSGKKHLRHRSCVHKYTPFPGSSLKLIPCFEIHLMSSISQNQFWWVNNPEGGWFQQNRPLKLHGVGSGSSSRKFWSFSCNQQKQLQMLLQSFPMWSIEH